MVDNQWSSGVTVWGSKSDLVQILDHERRVLHQLKLSNLLEDRATSTSLRLHGTHRRESGCCGLLLWTLCRHGRAWCSLLLWIVWRWESAWWCRTFLLWITHQRRTTWLIVVVTHRRRQGLWRPIQDDIASFKSMKEVVLGISQVLDPI